MQVLQERATLSNSLNGISLEADWKEEKIVLTADKVHEIFRHISDEDCFILKMDPEFARTACFELIGERVGKSVCVYHYHCHALYADFLWKYESEQGGSLYWRPMTSGQFILIIQHLIISND